MSALHYTDLQKALKLHRSAEQLVSSQRLRVAALERTSDTETLEKAKRLLVILSQILADRTRELEAAERLYRHDA